ncbi:MAG: copper amine oxidase N-terminal domain-containing protein [Candidatus Bruticola sp.]
MNKFSKALAAAAISLAFACPVSASVPDDFISVSVNGQILYLDQAPVLKDGTTLVPMRAIFEALGATIKWNAETKTVLANTASDAELMANPQAPNTSISLTINAPEATVNGQAVKLLAPAQIIAGNTMVPLRFVGEALGANVKWDGHSRLIRVLSDKAKLQVAEQKNDGTIVKIISPENEISYMYIKNEADTPSNWDLLSLKRLQVGGQAGILRVLDETGSNPIYTRTLDNYTTAAYSPEQRLEIVKHLGIDSSDANKIAVSLITNYVQNRKYFMQLVALLGAICSNKSLVLDDEIREQVMAFLVNKLQNGDPKLDANSNNMLKRQCLLSLALARKISPEALRAVVKYYESESNYYCLSPINFFFLSHAADIQALSDGSSLLERAKAVNSMYKDQLADAIAKGLKKQADDMKPIVPTASAAAPLKSEELEAIVTKTTSSKSNSATTPKSAPSKSTDSTKQQSSTSDSPVSSTEDAPLPKSVL